jgi:cardiolipin synthase
MTLLARKGESVSGVPFVDTGSYPTRGGNEVVPWIDGLPAFRRICEAVDAARRSVWVTVTFMWPSFRMPDGRGSALDLLERAARRGVDVRVIFWRPDEETSELRPNAFWGSAAHCDLLSRHYPHIKIRWDRAHAGYCQHQKSWLIDAEEEMATSFVGGINLNPRSLVTPEHRGATDNHDVYVELTGPSVADVHHNFVQRWNEASERGLPDGRWGDGSDEQMNFPERTPPARGGVVVQIQRTMHAGRYTDGHAPPGASPFSISSGERTNLDQHCAAIRAARRTIYLEHQYIQALDILSALHDALSRGVQIVAMVPAAPAISSPSVQRPRDAEAREWRVRLAGYDNFMLCGMAGVDRDGVRTPVYVHSKLMLVDDEWASVGSCNLHRYSLFGNGELNVAYHDSTAVRALRVALFHEHLGTDSSELADTEALLLFQRTAHENRGRHERRDAHWRGMAFSLNAAGYGVEPQL